MTELEQKVKRAERLLSKMGKPGRMIVNKYQYVEDPEEKLKSLVLGYQKLKLEIKDQIKYKEKPVDIETFVTDPYYLNMPVKPHMDEPGEIYPAVIEELKKMTEKDYVEIVLTGSIGCWPGEAEFLSERGWVRFDEYSGEKVAEYDPKTENVGFKAAEYVELDADSWCVFNNKTCFDMKVSPEHTVLLRGRSGAIKTAKAEQLINGEVKLTSYTIPSTFNVNRKGVELTDDEIRLMVAVLADGNFHPHLKKSNKKCRIGVRKERKKQRLKEILSRLDKKWTTNGPYKNRPTEITYLFESPLRTKKWDWAWECNTRQLEIIFNEIPHWYGLHPDSSPTGEWRFHTTEESARDFIQYMCHSTGHRTTVRTVKGEKKNHKDTIFVRARHDTGKDYDMRGVYKRTEKPLPGEKKYCFTTSTGFFIARYKNRVMVSGNSAKTTCALILLCYHLYLLSTLRDPHKEYGLMKSDEIVLVFQSLSASHAKTVDYSRFKAMVENSKYFRNNFMFDKNIDSQMNFPNRVTVKPISGKSTGAIGENVMSGILDEINFMQVTEKSKLSHDSGEYDQAKENYTALVRRRESRFLKQGRIPGILCLVSSKRYPGEFTDQKIEEAKTNDKIYIYDKRSWDITPPGRFTGDTFRLFVGDLTRNPKILEPHEEVPIGDKHLVDQIPKEFLHAFRTDMSGAIRDIAGRTTLALEPFILNVEAVGGCFGKTRSILSRTECDFDTTSVAIYPRRIKNINQPRFMHIDLAATGDSVGISMGCVPGFTNIKRGEDVDDVVETLPVINMDFTLEVRPPKGKEIPFHKIRKLIYELTKIGVNIEWITLDSWQSIDMIQILKRKGYKVGIQSIDTTTAPYDITKAAFIDDRVRTHEHELCLKEFVSLEKDNKKSKVDHPKGGSKDVSDSFAGVVYGLTMRRKIWVHFGIPLQSIPTHLVQRANNHKNSIDNQGE